MTILVDANLLVYARISSLEDHRRAYDWLMEVCNGTDRVGLPWESLLAFYRITTSQRILQRQLTVEMAWKQVREWLALPVVHVPVPGERHADILSRLVTETRSVAGHIHDAHLAALAIEHGLKLCSCDGDFARYRGLRWENPLLA